MTYITTYMCCILTHFHEWQNDRRLITCNTLKPHIQLSNLKTNISFTWVKWLRTFALWLRHHLNQKVEPTGLGSSRYLSKIRFSKTASADVLENKLCTTLFMTGGVYGPISVKYMQRLLCVRDNWDDFMSNLDVLPGKNVKNDDLLLSASCSHTPCNRSNICPPPTFTSAQHRN